MVKNIFSRILCGSHWKSVFHLHKHHVTHNTLRYKIHPNETTIVDKGLIYQVICSQLMTTSTSKFDPAYLIYLQDHPQETVAAILRCERLDPAFEQELLQAGLHVHRKLRLIRGYAVEGCAFHLIEIAGAPWVLRIEPDQTVHTMP